MSVDRERIDKTVRRVTPRRSAEFDRTQADPEAETPEPGVSATGKHTAGDLSTVDDGTRERAMARLQYEHGNAYVQRVVARQSREPQVGQAVHRQPREPGQPQQPQGEHTGPGPICSVMFQPSTSTLLPGERDRLRAAIEALPTDIAVDISSGRRVVHIIGYAFMGGTRQTNARMSIARAMQLLDGLYAQLGDQARIVPHGQGGESQPPPSGTIEVPVWARVEVSFSAVSQTPSGTITQHH